MVQLLNDHIPRDAESGAALALRDDQGRFLFALAGTRFDCPPGTRFYMGIGGHRLLDEDLPTCAHREAMEEIGADVDIVDSDHTWLISQGRLPDCLELSDRPRPYALYLMPRPGSSEHSALSYHIAIYLAELPAGPGQLSGEEVSAVIALTAEQVVRGLHARPSLDELVTDGAEVVAQVGQLDGRLRVYPIGTAEALAHVLSHPWTQ